MQRGEKRSFSSAASPHGLKRSVPTRQGKRLLNPSEASQPSGWHRRPGAALAASPCASPLQPEGREGSRSPAAGRARRRQGRQRSPPRGSSWQAGSGRAVTHPSNVLARRPRLPVKVTQRARLARPQRGQSPPGGTGSGQRSPARATATGKQSSEPHRGVGTAPVGEAAETSRSDPWKRDSGVWSFPYGARWGACLTPADASCPSLQAPGISSQGSTANLPNLQQSRARNHNLKSQIYLLIF